MHAFISMVHRINVHFDILQRITSHLEIWNIFSWNYYMRLPHGTQILTFDLTFLAHYSKRWSLHTCELKSIEFDAGCDAGCDVLCMFPMNKLLAFDSKLLNWEPKSYNLLFRYFSIYFYRGDKLDVKMEQFSSFVSFYYSSWHINEFFAVAQLQWTEKSFLFFLQFGCVPWISEALMYHDNFHIYAVIFRFIVIFSQKQVFTSHFCLKIEFDDIHHLCIQLSFWENKNFLFMEF